MTKPLILNPAQAQAVYGAMCALNNVSATVKASFGDVATDGINVFENHDGFVSVARVRRYDVLESEHYPSQAAFAVAYRVNESAALLADALAEPADAMPRGLIDDEAECHPDNHGPLSNLPHDA